MTLKFRALMLKNNFYTLYEMVLAYNLTSENILLMVSTVSVNLYNNSAISINITLHKGQRGKGGAGGWGVLLMLVFLMKFTLSSLLKHLLLPSLFCFDCSLVGINQDMATCKVNFSSHKGRAGAFENI